MFQTSGNQCKKTEPAVGHLAVCAAWAAVALFFGWKEFSRQDQLEQAVTALARSIAPTASPEVLTDLHAVVVATGRPDWTILALLALIISLRSLYSAIGVDRLARINTAAASVLRRL
ncbi:hypothetical protein [Jannaschia sp. 2305UL9-9]|uniref:hypothetical protein n=1 Tax=Jannaschia sp. 2305UL9-9 TaxID=3121638 RepID=UPI0035281CBD